MNKKEIIMNKLIKGTVNIKKLNPNNTNEILEEYNEPIHSFTKYALDLWGVIFEPKTYWINDSRIKDIEMFDVNDNMGSLDNLYLHGLYCYNNNETSTYGLDYSGNENDDIGIVIGQGDVDWSINDNKLQNLIAFGSGNVWAYVHNSIGYPTNGNTDPINDLWNESEGIYEMNPISRRFMNQSSSAITINEIGMYMNSRWSNKDNMAHKYIRQICILRDVLTTPITFNPNDLIEISYIFKFNPKINKNIMGLFMGQFWSADSDGNSYWKITRLNNDGTVYGTGYINALSRDNPGTGFSVATTILSSRGNWFGNFYDDPDWNDVRSAQILNITTNNYDYGILLSKDDRVGITQASLSEDNTDHNRLTSIACYPMQAYDVNISKEWIESNEYSGMKMSRLFYNDTSESKTFNVVSIIAVQYRVYSGANKQYLMYKELLDSEVTLEPGDSFYYEFVYQANAS